MRVGAVSLQTDQKAFLLKVMGLAVLWAVLLVPSLFAEQTSTPEGANRPIRKPLTKQEANARDAADHSAWMRGHGQPDLRELTKVRSAEVYRFTYLPTLGKKPLVLTLRVSARQGRGVLDVLGLTARGELELTGKISVKDEALNELRKTFSNPEVIDPFRNTGVKYGDSSAGGADGAWWMIETLRGGKYTYASLWSPNWGYKCGAAERDRLEMQMFGEKLPSYEPFVLACRELVVLAEVPLEPDPYSVFPNEWFSGPDEKPGK